MLYIALKQTHVACVIISVTLFAFRSGAQLAGVDWRRWRVLKIAPHIVDTVLLASAIGLAIILHQYPFVHHWLTAKVLALVLYILLGHMALKPGFSRWTQAGFALAALATIGYIIRVALTRQTLLG